MIIKLEDITFIENNKPEFDLFSMKAYVRLSAGIDLTPGMLHSSKEDAETVIGRCKLSLWEMINHELFHPVADKLYSILREPSYFKREDMIKELIKEML